MSIKIDKHIARTLLNQLEFSDSPSDCWIPKSKIGGVRYGKKMISLVRLSYYSIHDDDTFKYKQKVFRICGNSRCFNPNHLVFDEMQRFWKFVVIGTKEDCWNWTRSKDIGGYGVFISPKYGREKAHRVAYSEQYGKIPADMCVLHACDNPSCCNPYHLFLGTDWDNVCDKVNKNRQHHPVGVLNGRAILNPNIVSRLKGDFEKHSMERKKLAHKYGISKTQMYRIIRNESWV